MKTLERPARLTLPTLPVGSVGPLRLANSASVLSRRTCVAGCAALLGILGLNCAAADFSLSGFGTLGYARSDRSYAYQRFIDDKGTLRRDSVAGLQLDAKLTDQIGATVQVKAAPDTNNDARYEASVSWAFVSWRPTDDLLLRAGKQRLPLYLHSQNYDVGVTYDFARLPTEMYSISPSNDFTGVSASKSWDVDGNELVLDSYFGRSEADVRFWLRDGSPPSFTPDAFFRRIQISGGGAVISYKTKFDTYRAGFGRVTVRESHSPSSYPVTYPFVSLAPNYGYFQVDPALPGPGIPSIESYGYKVFTLGADVAIGNGFRITSEYARSLVSKTNFSTQSSRGYVSLLRRIDQWTPYVAYAFLHSEKGVLDLRDAVNSNVVPNFVPGAARINASQRAGADSFLVFDQSSWALGASYSISATSSLKAEVMRTHIGRVSSLVDAPPGSNIRNQHINVLSVSYSFVF
ncbi:MAG: hypothetical protein ABI343_13135 [Burkholderiaceae bacterium]